MENIVSILRKHCLLLRLFYSMTLVFLYINYLFQGTVRADCVVTFSVMIWFAEVHFLY